MASIYEAREHNQVNPAIQELTDGVLGYGQNGPSLASRGIPGTALALASVLAFSTSPGGALAEAAKDAVGGGAKSGKPVDLTPAYDNFGPYSDAEIKDDSIDPAKSARDNQVDFIKANPAFAAQTAHSAATEAKQAWVYREATGQVPNGNQAHDAALEQELYESDRLEVGTLVADQEVVDYDADHDGSVSDKQVRVLHKGQEILGFTYSEGKVPKSAMDVSVDTDGDGEADDRLIAIRDLGDDDRADYSPFHEEGCKCAPCAKAQQAQPAQPDQPGITPGPVDQPEGGEETGEPRKPKRSPVDQPEGGEEPEKGKKPKRKVTPDKRPVAHNHEGGNGAGGRPEEGMDPGSDSDETGYGPGDTVPAPDPDPTPPAAEPAPTPAPTPPEVVPAPTPPTPPAGPGTPEQPSGPSEPVN